MRTVCHHFMFRRLVAAVLMLDLAVNTLANPHGMTVQSGSATTAVSGSQLTVTASQNAFLNWQSFNIATGETTIFNQPSSTSIVWNRINGQNPSQIFGSLQANGVVVLLNSSGFYFGPNSFVSAAGLVVSTANCAPPQNSGGAWEFNGPPPLASIVNYGQIKIGSGGSAFLIADQVENHGSIEAPGGAIGLAAGQTVLLSERPDGRGMSMAVTLPQGSVDNEGRLIADGGTIAMNAKVVNQNGFLQANSVRDQDGVIELVASDQLSLGANSQISANGDDSAGGSAGGNVTLQSGNTFSDSVGSQIDVTGGSQGGNGGNVEISAPSVLSLNSGINARAQTGWTAGKLLLDPDYIILDTSGSDSISSGTVLSTDGGTGSTLDLNVNTAFANLAVSQIILQAVDDITLAGGTSWNLSQTIGANFGGVTSGQLTLEAGNNIIFGDRSSISDANGWSVTLKAGVSFPSEVVQSGSGSIYLTGGQINGVTQTVGGSIQTTAGSISLEAGLDIQTGVGSLTDINYSFPFALESASGAISLNAGQDIQIGSSSVVTTGGGGITATAGRDLLMNGGSLATFGGGDITVTAERDIQTGAGSLTDINYGFSFALESVSGAISLNAGRDIQIGSGSVDTTGGGGITATAGRDLLMDGGSIATLVGGDITVTAERDIQVGSGSITTIGGGNITATATTGSVDTGTYTGGYDFTTPGLPIDQVAAVETPVPGTLGGISTAAGGDVKIIAGLDIISFLPDDVNKVTTDAGSGAFGSGNVTLNAGRNVVGHYVVANGTGTINAAVDIPLYLQNQSIVLSNPGNAGTTAADPGCADGDPEPTPQRELALSLISGSWTVNAANDINLQEVRNPNGVFNDQGTAKSSRSYHLFNYAAGDSVTLDAGNSVLLLGDNLPRNANDSDAPPIIYAPTLDITAGAGGIVLDNEIILFPSKQGSLSITTTGGGSFESGAYADYLTDYANYLVDLADYNNLSPADQAATSPPSPPLIPTLEAQFIMSDSSRTKYIANVDAFGISDHAATPVHFSNPTTVALNISGDMDNIELVSPEAAQINVVGDMNNCSYIGQNLHPGDVTSINVGAVAKANMENSGLLDPNTDSGIRVGGDILNQGEFSSVSVASQPDLSLLNQAYINGQFTPLADLFSRLHYDPATGLLTFQGQMNPTYEGYLTSLLIQKVDANGTPLFNSDGTPQTETISILNSATASELYQDSLNAPATQNPGYFIGGGGQFNINARNLNLGSTLGIQSVGPAKNGALASYCHFTQGADINLDLSGNLDIFSTTICALNGGNITVDAGGYVNIGSTSFTGNDQYVRGLFTVGPGNVTVLAQGDINVNGSRIAAYDGGNVTVESVQGNVDAGNGGSGSVAVEEIYVDPVTYNVYSFSPYIPLSGILAMTFPPRSSFFPAPEYGVGNILVVAPEGNITGASGGIVQFPLNSSDSSAATVTLLAGKQPVLDTSATGNDVVQLYIFDSTTETWKLEKGALQIADVDIYDPTTGTKITEKQVKDEPVLTGQNIIGFGPTFQLMSSDGSPILDAQNKPIYLTPILVAGGNPLLAADGQPLYVEDLGATGGPMVERIAKDGVPGVQAYTDALGGPVNVSLPLDANGNPFPDSQGNPTFVIGRNVDAKNSGVIGSQVYLDATGNITGTFFARQNLVINALQNVTATALSEGTASVSGSSLGDSTIIGIGGISVGGDATGASLLSNNQISGDTGGSKGLSEGTTANAASQGLANEDAAKPADDSTTDNLDDEKKKKGKAITLAQKTGRVTVVLPPKPQARVQPSPTQTLEPRT